MQDEVRVRGRLSGRRIELDEDVEEFEGEVEVVVRPLPSVDAYRPRFLDVIGELPPGSRSEEDIDQQLHAARAEWTGRA